MLPYLLTATGGFVLGGVLGFLLMALLSVGREIDGAEWPLSDEEVAEIRAQGRAWEVANNV